MLYKINLNKIFVFTLFLFVIFFINVFFSSNLIFANNVQKIKEIEEKIKNLKNERDGLTAEINKIRQQQRNLSEEKKLIEQQILQNRLQIDLLELEIEKIQIDLNFVEEEKNKVEQRLDELQKSLDKAQKNLEQSLNLLYKISKTSTSILDYDFSFELNLLNNEKERSTIRLIKAKINEIKTLTNELNLKKNEVLAKHEELKVLKSTLQAKYDSLDMQKQALSWQVNNKDLLIKKALEQEKTVSNQLNTYSREILQLELMKSNLVNQIANMPLPANATFVEAGQVIGFQGRSGLSCDVYDASLEPVRDNDWCQRFGFLSSYFYYYNPIKYPTKGSHLHFEYSVNGVRVNPYNYIVNAGKPNSIFKFPPLTPYTFTQGFSSSHPANDLVNYHRAPVYAVRAGYVSYYCLNYPNDPKFPDPTYFAVIRHVDENGKLDGTNSRYLHLDRGNRPCVFVN